METLQDRFPADAVADALGVSPAGFAAHRHKPQRARPQQDAELSTLIAQSFRDSRQTYGSPRICRDLRDLGRRCGKNRINRLMREQGLRAKQKRRFRPRTTNSNHPLPIAENWLAKVPAPDRPGQIWQSDFTYLETAEGWLYLAFTLDACSRRCVAHHCREDREKCEASRSRYQVGIPHCMRGILGGAFRILRCMRGISTARVEFSTAWTEFSVASSEFRTARLEYCVAAQAKTFARWVGTKTGKNFAIA